MAQEADGLWLEVVGGAEAADGAAGVALVVGGEDVFFGAAFGEADDVGMEAIGDGHGDQGGVVPEAGGEEDIGAAWAEDAGELVEDGVRVDDVLHDGAGVGEVDGGVFEAGGGGVGLVDVDAGGEVIGAEGDEVDAPELGGVAEEVAQEGGGAAAADLEEGVIGGEAATDLAFEDVVGVGVVAVDAFPEAVCESGAGGHGAAEGSGEG